MIRLNFLNNVILTSESWSFSKVKNMGKIYSLEFFLPIIGDNDKTEEAKESKDIL